jgi:hypothetical protein
MPTCGVCGRAGFAANAAVVVQDGRCFDCVPEERRTFWWKFRRRAPWVLASLPFLPCFVVVIAVMSVLVSIGRAPAWWRARHD